MNFGPINQRGGEKRLNVIFSRARHHMAVISSIRHFDITNDYNDGAACLRNFLEYAAACSTGDAATSRRVLHAANPAGSAGTASISSAASIRDAPADEPVVAEMAAALRARGLCVDRDVGQSTFRLPLAVRRNEPDAHALGILIDDGSHYAQRDLLERYLLRPGVLQAFGWRVVQVFTKDWHHDRDAVLRQIDDALAGVEPEPIEVEAPPAPPPPPPTYPSSEEPAIADAVAVEEAPPEPAPKPARVPVPPRVVVTPTAAAPAAPATPRYFTCSEDGSNKFWEIAVNGAGLTVRFGRIGTNGQTQTKTFASADAALREQDRLIRSKLAKGYVEAARA
jgi:predicted DNA-binding WGR domain protein